MGDKDGPNILLNNGCSYPYRDMDKLAMLMEKHSSLLNSADPDKAKKGFEMINDEGKECIWHVHDKCLQVAEELSTLWNRLGDYAKSIDMESLGEEEAEDGGMDHKVYDQIVEYLKTGRIPYENYSNRGSATTHFRKKCSPYSLADDGQTLHKGRAVVLKKGEVMKAIAIYHHICGHSNARQMREFFGQLCDPSCLKNLSAYVASCSCGKMIHINCKDLTVSVKNMGGGRRDITISSEQESCDTQDIFKKGLNTKMPYSLTEAEYEKEFTRARLSSSSKFQIARDGKTLITSSGAIVLKTEEAINVCMRIHELCGHLNKMELPLLIPRFIFVTGFINLASAVGNKCHFCRCRAKAGNMVVASPISVQNVSLDIKVHYDEGASERRFQIITHGVDPKVVEHYVNASIDTMKKYGKWKEPVFSPEAALARSVLRVVDLLKGEEEGMGNIVDFDPIHNDILSNEVHMSGTMNEERGPESDTESVTESLVDVSISEEEEDEEKMVEEENVEEDEDESDVEDEELREMRRRYEERERQAEAMENEARRLADATGRMRAYIRQWEFSDYLQELIRLEENSHRERMANEDEEEEREKSGESEEEAEMRENEGGKEVDKENNSALCEENPSSSGMGVLTGEEKKLVVTKKKRGGKKNKKGKGELEKPPYDLTPYKANHEEKGDAVPDVSNTVQIERVEMEHRERKAVFPSSPPPLTRDGHPARKRGRLAQLRREKDELERKTKEEEMRMQPVYNPYAAAFNGNMWPEEEMEKRRRMREERERRNEEGLTESEEDEEYEE